MTVNVSLDVQEIDYLMTEVLKQTDPKNEKFTVLSKLNMAKGRLYRAMEMD